MTSRRFKITIYGPDKKHAQDGGVDFRWEVVDTIKHGTWGPFYTSQDAALKAEHLEQTYK